MKEYGLYACVLLIALAVILGCLYWLMGQEVDNAVLEEEVQRARRRAARNAYHTVRKGEL